MRAVIQRVSFARVEVENQNVAEIQQGVMILLGIGKGDEESEALKLAQKIAQLRIFSDSEEKMNVSLLDIQGEALVVSQFTLYADCNRGRRPYFGDAELPERAKKLCESFVTFLSQQGVQVKTGIFAANMQVTLCNEGPVTIVLETDKTV